jgi:hypothetical protein
VDANGQVPMQPLDAFVQGKYTPVPMILGTVSAALLCFLVACHTLALLLLLSGERRRCAVCAHALPAARAQMGIRPSVILVQSFNVQPDLCRLDIIFGFNNSKAIRPLYPVPSNETSDIRDTLSQITTHYTVSVRVLTVK